MITGKIVKHHLQQVSNLVFEVTETCNLNCRYCAFSDLYRSYEKREEKMFSFEKARLIIDYLMKLKDYPPDVNYPFTIQCRLFKRLCKNRYFHLQIKLSQSNNNPFSFSPSEFEVLP